MPLYPLVSVFFFDRGVYLHWLERVTQTSSDLRGQLLRVHGERLMDGVTT